MEPTPSAVPIRPRPGQRYSFSEYTEHPYGEDDDDLPECNCCIPRRSPLSGGNFCRLMGGVFMALCFLSVLGTGGNLLFALILASFMTLVAALAVGLFLCIVRIAESGWEFAYASRYALYYFCCCISRVDVPPETLWEVASFLPHRSPLWRINRLFAMRVLEIRDWNDYMKRIRIRDKGIRRTESQITIKSSSENYPLGILAQKWRILSLQKRSQAPIPLCYFWHSFPFCDLWHSIHPERFVPLFLTDPSGFSLGFELASS